MTFSCSSCGSPLNVLHCCIENGGCLRCLWSLLKVSDLANNRLWHINIPQFFPVVQSRIVFVRYQNICGFWGLCAQFADLVNRHSLRKCPWQFCCERETPQWRHGHRCSAGNPQASLLYRDFQRARNQIINSGWLGSNSLELNNVFASQVVKDFSFFEENTPVFFVWSQQFFLSQRNCHWQGTDKDQTKWGSSDFFFVS